MNFYKKLGIRAKIISSVTFFLIIFFLIEAAIFYQVFLTGFVSVEEQDMVSDVQRVEGLIDNEIDNYSVKLSDWANWDDTYNFIIDGNEAYVESNLQDTSLENLQLNFMIFIASNGAIIKEKSISSETGRDIPIPPDFHELLSKPGIITTHKSPDSKSQGILRISSGFILFVSRPILTSDGVGPIRGTLIFARYIDKEFIEKIAHLERSKVSIHDYNSNSLPEDFRRAKELLPTEGIKRVESNGKIDTYYIDKQGINTINGFTVIHDIYNQPAFIIENELQRPFYALGNSIVIFALTIFAVLSTISILFGVFILNRNIISKITKLNKDVEDIKNPNNFKKRLEVKGEDEFTNLATNINNMLDQIGKSQEELSKFKQAIENTSDHIIITDPEGIIIYANKASQEMTEYSLEEMLGKTPRIWGGQMPKEFYERLWDTIKNKKQEFKAELTNRKKSGQLYPVMQNITPILDKQGNVSFFVAVERDVTAEKRLQENLLKQNEEIAQKVKLQTQEIREEQDRLFNILESMPTGIFILNAQGLPYYMNSEAKRLLGKNLVNVGIDELSQTYGVYKAGTNMLYPSDELPVVQAYHGKPAVRRDIEVRNGEKKIILEVTSAPIFDSEGKIIFAIAAFKDITEENILSRSKDEFFSIASHELRTPLTAIRGNTALIKQYYQDQLSQNKDLNEMVDDIHDSSIRLIQIVNDFLNVSRLEQGKMEFKLENFDLTELIANKIEEIKSIAEPKGLIVKMETPIELIPQVYADKSRLGEVILNLLGNAINYSDKGQITIDLKISGEFVKVFVKDMGKGIPDQYKNLLFRKFQQASESILTRDTSKGTGLGLYISKLMIDQMGGEIHLESSEEGVGSVFSFIVPVAK